MRRELEADLERTWSRENLGVYADFLQSEDDPRGEWIAMDLAILQAGLDAATQQRRDRLLEPYRQAGFTNLRYGFGDYAFHEVERGDPMPLRALLATLTLGSYIRALTLTVPMKSLDAAFAIVGEFARPALHRIAIQPVFDGRSQTKRELSKHVGARTLQQLVDATPNLRALELRGDHHTFTSFVHPNVPGGPIARNPEYRSRLFEKLEVQIGEAPLELVEMGRLLRLHLGIVDELDHAAREAWAELRFAIEFLENELGEPLASGHAFPGEILDRVVATTLDVPLYGADWCGIRDKRAAHPAAPVRLRRV